MSSDLTLSKDVVHVFFADPASIDDPSLLADYFTLLNKDEQTKQSRFLFDKHRQLYLVSHTLVRTVLSLFLPLPPSAWTFQKNQYGRPDAVLPPGSPPLSLNLSHTDGLAVCAVSCGRDIGIDVEHLKRRGRTVELAQRYFSASEVSALNQLKSHEQRDRFFDLWTLKESYMKARGIGISLGLGNFSFQLNTDEPIQIAFSSAINDDPKSWQFAVFDKGDSHRVSLSVGKQNNKPVTLRIHQTTPLKTVHDLSQLYLAARRYPS
jgi:4'-phosphopantetheinyl transferase